MLPESLHYLLAFLFAIGVLISFHELGHYLVARWCGVRVLRFSIGMGKTVWRYQAHPDATEWVLALIPLGGYVKMLDSREPEMAALAQTHAQGDFSQKNVWQRIAIVAAGPVANFLLAIVIFSSQFVIGIEEPVARAKVASVESIAYQAGLRHGDVIASVNAEPVASWSQFRWKLLQAAVAHRDTVLSITRPHPELPGSQINLELSLPTAKLSASDLEKDILPILGIALYRPAALLTTVQENGPAAKAGVKAGDVVLAIDGRAMLDGQDLAETVGRSAGQDLRLTIKRGNDSFDLQLKPETKQEGALQVGRIMVAPDARVATTQLRFGVVDAVVQGASKTWDNTALTFRMLGKILTGEVSWRNITGPITIADYAGQTARMGAFFYLSLIAMLSISLGVMNLLPIPVLDGGHLLYYSLEVLTGKQIPVKYLDMAQRGGLVVLLCLMGIAFFNDVVRQVAKFVQ